MRKYIFEKQLSTTVYKNTNKLFNDMNNCSFIAILTWREVKVEVASRSPYDQSLRGCQVFVSFRSRLVDLKKLFWFLCLRRYNLS